MPLYEYQCTKCKKLIEKIEPVNGPHLKKCPHCGGKVERQLAAPAIQFKGSGWYVTDYAGKSGGAKGEAASKSEASEKPKSETKEALKDSSTSKPSKEKKGSK